MKSPILAVITALLVGCGESPKPPTAEPAKPTKPAEPARSAEPFNLIPELPVRSATPKTEVVAETIELAAELNEADLALRAAASSGDLQEIEQLLEAGVDLNAIDADGKTLYEKGVRDEVMGSFLRKHGAKTSRELQLEGK